MRRTVSSTSDILCEKGEPLYIHTLPSSIGITLPPRDMFLEISYDLSVISSHDDDRYHNEAVKALV
jgi:hypothetical protein